MTASNSARRRAASDNSASRDRLSSSFQHDKPSWSSSVSKSVSATERDADLPASGLGSRGYVHLGPIPNLHPNRVETTTFSLPIATVGSENESGCPTSSASRSTTARYDNDGRMGETSVAMMPSTGESNVSNVSDDGDQVKGASTMPLSGKGEMLNVLGGDDRSTRTSEVGSTYDSGKVYYRTTRLKHVETAQGSFHLLLIFSLCPILKDYYRYGFPGSRCGMKL